jgi:calcineurin-like phosphoesterase
MDKVGVFRRLIEQMPTRFEVAAGPAMLNGVRLEIDMISGKTNSIERVRFLEPDAH